MRIISTLAAGLITAVIAAPVMAEGVKIYPFASKENYCPSGLQPITISGVICCGVPNQNQLYQQVMKHPATSYVRHTRSASTCPEGVKGCY